ncbi:hypothetical protein MBANPS3_009579 [Mucor bainieri]
MTIALLPDSENSNRWGTLPNEILHRIFGYVQVYPVIRDPSDAANFHACQLVCKGWSKPAQETLYYEIRLGSNGRKFQEQASMVGALVKKIVLLEEFLGLGSCFPLLLLIMQQCPNVEELYATFNTGSVLLTPFLLSKQARLQPLKVFRTEGDQIFSASVYPQIAFKYKHSLTHLYLSLKTHGFDGLVERLSEFEAVKHLRVDDLTVTHVQELDSLIGKCPSTTTKLSFNRISMEDSVIVDKSAIVPNKHVRHLEIKMTRGTRANLLAYFTLKFEGLETLTVELIGGPPDGLRDKIEWWVHMTKLCLPLKAYRITLGALESAYTPHADPTFKVMECLDNCVNMMVMNSAQNKRVLKIDQRCAELVMVKQNSEYEIMLGMPIDYDNIDFGPLTRFSRPLPYMYQYWALYDKLLTAFNQATSLKLQNFSFGRQPSVALAGQAEYPNITELHLESSAILEQVLSYLTVSLPNLEKLTINAVRTTDPFKLFIRLPSSLRHLKVLKINTSNGDGYLSRVLTNEDYGFTLKIHTEENGSNTYLDYSPGLVPVPQTVSEDMNQGTKDNFLIWIDCVDLSDELIIEFDNFVVDGTTGHVTWRKTIMENGVVRWSPSTRRFTDKVVAWDAPHPLKPFMLWRTIF